MAGNVFHGDNGNPVGRNNPLPVDGGQENPFSTKEGQAVVSVSEGFWARMLRHGRPISTGTGSKFAMTDTAGSKNFVGPSITAEPGMILYPRFVVISADIDCEIAIKIVTGLTPTGIAPEVTNHEFSVFLAKGIPYRWDFNGEIFCVDTDKSGSTSGVYVGYRTATAGNMYVAMYGVEVAKDA